MRGRGNDCDYMIGSVCDSQIIWLQIFPVVTGYLAKIVLVLLLTHCILFM